MNKTCSSIQWLFSAVSQTGRPCSCWHTAGAEDTATHGAAFWLLSVRVPCSWGHLFVLDLLPLALNFCWEHQRSQTITSGDCGAQLFSWSVWDCCESHLNCFCAVAETYCQAATHLCSPCGSSCVLSLSWLSCFGDSPAPLSSLVLVKHCFLVMLSGPSAAVLGAHVPFQIAQADRKQKPSMFLLQEWMFAGVR